jgi:carboxyl-terminal processing protease
MARYARDRGFDVAAPDTEGDDGMVYFYRGLKHVVNETGLSSDSLALGGTRFAIAAVDPRCALLEPAGKDDARISVDIAAGNGGVVVFPSAGGPAYLAGLRCGDVVVSVDGASMAHAHLAEFIRRARGPDGSECTLTFHRPGSDSLRTVTVARSVHDHTDPGLNPQFVRRGVAYVKLRTIERGTGTKLVYALEQLLLEAPIGGLVLDLREAHGGSRFEEACAIADVFLAAGRIAAVDWFNGEHDVYDARAPVTLRDRRIIALIGPGTGLGGELVAAALRYNNRAVLLGRPTAGAGLAYRLLPAGGFEMWMPAGRFLLPSNESFDGTGIEPDISFAGQGRAAIDAAVDQLRPGG